MIHEQSIHRSELVNGVCVVQVDGSWFAELWENGMLRRRLWCRSKAEARDRAKVELMY